MTNKTDPNKACSNERQHLGWALVHDGLAHPLMALTGYCKLALRFHDWTSRKAWPRRTLEYYGGDLTTCLGVEQRLRSAGVAFVVTSAPNFNRIDPRGYVYKVERL